ncbi:hypothetical protein CDIMF43_70027 [Carnobacterium divergens]|nr:hypothetical protein CDIMF43_70027 [Carnobacterium divergens]
MADKVITNKTINGLLEPIGYHYYAYIIPYVIIQFNIRRI